MARSSGRVAATVTRMPRSPEPARRRLLDAALELFATNGISSTSLREIRLAAGQRNAGALQYHFGDKDGLLRALLERELPLLVDRRRALLEVATDAPSIAAVYIAPFAELATGTARERWVVQFLSQLHDDPSLSLDDISALIGDTGAAAASELLRPHLGQLPPEIVNERVRVGLTAYLHACAMRARGHRSEEVDAEQFRRNITTMFLAALLAP